MYALIDENDNVISKSDKQHKGKAVKNINDGVWKEFQIPQNLETKEIKYDPVSDSIVEDTDAESAKQALKQKQDDAISVLSGFDDQNADLSEVRTAVQALIDIVTP